MKRPPASWGPSTFTSLEDIDHRYFQAVHAADGRDDLRLDLSRTVSEISGLRRLGIHHGTRLDELMKRRRKLEELLPGAAATATAETLALHARLFGAWRWLRDRAAVAGVDLDRDGDCWRLPYSDFRDALAMVERLEGKPPTS